MEQFASNSRQITQMLQDWSEGNNEVLDKLMPLVYEELRRQASRYLRKERQGHTLQTTALIHEAYLKLIDQRDVRWQNRAHFFAIAAQAMRRILVDYARERKREKRGGAAENLPLDEAFAIVSREKSVDLVALDEALNKLAKFDERQAKVVELRYFSGLSIDEYATHLVYLTESNTPDQLEKETMLSILERTPKRADVYWFLHVKTDNEPFTADYEVETLAKEDVYFMTLTLGFRIDQRINYFFELAIEDMQESNEVTLTSRHPALQQYNIPGDIRFVLLSSFLSHENELPFKQHFIMRSYYFIRRWLSIREDEAYGLDASKIDEKKLKIKTARKAYPEKNYFNRFSPSFKFFAFPKI